MNYLVNSNTDYYFNGNPDGLPELPIELIDDQVQTVFELITPVETSNIDKKISRTIFFDQEINENSATSLRAQMMALCAEDLETPIRLMLGSPGGGLYESLAIYDTIKMLPVKTIAICSGKVMSGGILILLACDERVSTPNTTFMIHHGHTVLSGNILELQEQIKEITTLNDRMLDTIIKRTSIRRDQLDEWLVKDHYLSVEQAVKYGLIDNVISKLNELDGKITEEQCQELIQAK